MTELEQENNGKHKIQIPEELLRVLDGEPLEKESGEGDDYDLEDVLKMLEN